MADTEGQWHRVCLNTIVRKGRELDSERLRILPMGSRVRVQETVDRRVRIDMPVAGWCSLRSSNGDTILSPLQNQAEDGQMTPSVSGNQQKYYENYKENLEKKRRANEDATKLSQQLLEIQAQIQKAQAEVNQQEDLAKQMEELTTQKEQLLQESQESAKRALGDLGIDPEHLEDAQTKLEQQQSELAKQIAEANNYINACRKEVQDLKNKVNDPDSMSTDKEDFRNGDVVCVDRLGLAIVRYFGEVTGQEGKFVGVELEDAIGDTNGVYLDTEYFSVKDNHGMFLPTTDIQSRILPMNFLQKLQKQLQKREVAKSSQE